MAMEDATLVKHAKQTFVLRSNTSGESFNLQGEMLVGREVECAIPLNSGHISRYHAKINVSSYGVYVEDLNSTNGTFVNGNKIKGRIRLSLGDEVAFDDLGFRLTSSQAGAEAETHLSTPNRKLDRLDLPSRPFKASPPIEKQSQEAVFDSIDEMRDTPLDELDNLPIPNNTPPVKKEKTADAIDKDEEQAKPAARAKPNNVTPISVAKVTNDAEEEDFDEGNDRTQILSSSQLNALVEKHRDEKELNLGSGPRLIVMTAPIRGKIFGLQKHGKTHNWQIGRDPQAEIFLNDKTISTDHARLARQTSGNYILYATHAKNGIYVNGSITTKCALQHGDKIQIGRTELTFKTDELDSVDSPQDLRNFTLESPKSQSNGLITAIFVVIVLIAAVVISQ